MKDRDLVLIGGGGHCRSVIEVAESAGYNIIGILDKYAEVGKTVLDYKIIGTDDDIKKYINSARFVVTVGQIKSSLLRHKLVDLVIDKGGEFATIIASTAHVSTHARVGAGTVIMHKACVNAGVIIGDNSIINTMSNIEHDTCIGNFSHISTGVMVNGGCSIGNNVFVGSQSIISNSVSIVDNVIIGAGSLLLNSLNEEGMYYGHPITLR